MPEPSRRLRNKVPGSEFRGSEFQVPSWELGKRLRAESLKPGTRNPKPEPGSRNGRVMQETITLQCTECKRKNYSSTKNRKNVTDRLELKKYCRWCRRHTLHREVR